ncbi:MAG TPA: efflux RND transporter permease subunit, partial [Thermoguttaceae bacterium]|nr:efflux RND transporter permease subunit [Thermoguttaceae bacterium]
VLQRGAQHEEPPYDVRELPIYRLSRAVLGPILDRRWLAGLVLLGVLGLFAAALLLPAFRVVPLKMLPYDNKNEFQIVIDMPEGSSLERTASAAHRLGEFLSTVNEVKDFQAYVGMASPMDFNGMVRHYFLRRGTHLADIRVNLAHKKSRSQQSHTILLRIRDRLTELAAEYGARVKLVETPPGPPVLSTITAEVYGPPDASYEELTQAAQIVEDRLRREPGVVDVDSTAEDDVEKWIFVTDKAKAALSGITTDQISRTLQLALSGMPVTVLHLPGEVHPLWVELRLPRSIRSAIDDLREIYVQGAGGHMVQLGALGEFRQTDAQGRPLIEEKTIYHKNLRRVAFVYGEVAGRPPADAIVDIQMDQLPDGAAPEPAPPATPRPVQERTWFRPGGGQPWAVPPGFQVVWHGEGEWKITLDVFRDLGLAFAAALLAIYVLLMFETSSRMLPLVIMLAIPLTMIGIMPGFWLLNLIANRPVGGYPDPVFFTATAMIGMIALAGIVVRNSVVLIDFIHHGQEYGLDLREAVIQSVAVRTRPILATAGTTLLGNWVITLDPIFSGLAWAIIFGIFASTVFTLVVVPVVYWLLYRRSQAG